MRQTATRFALALIVATVCLGLGSEAEANKLDISLARFIDCNSDGTRCEPDLENYELFLAEYAFGLAPKLLAPAETLGYSGFYLGLEGSLTPRPGTSGSTTRWKLGTAPDGDYPDVMFMPAIHIRKGLPWSFEIGGTINYLAQSELVGIGGELKWSLFEGYRHTWRGALPDLAVRGTIVRVIGESDMDMTLVGVDGSLSYAFGIGGMISLTPYAGFQYIWTIVRVEPLIYRDSKDNYHVSEDEKWNMNSLSGPNLGRAKLFGGFRFGYEMLAITLELGWGIKKDWEPVSDNDVNSVEVGNQIQISGGAGIDF
ncbi:MAG: hypothetical protein GY847_30580 [Proteobacteria bacterium]|nr:hypothetical protein [Pseudomonadota bacterium]